MKTIKDMPVGFTITTILGKVNDGSDTGGMQIIETTQKDTLYGLMRGIINQSPEGGWANIDDMKSAMSIVGKIDARKEDEEVEFEDTEVRMIKMRLNPSHAKYKINSMELIEALDYIEGL